MKSAVVAVVLSAWFSVGASSAGDITLSTPERTAFLRGEESAVLEIAISNGTGKDMRNVRASFEQHGAHGRIGVWVREIPVIKAGECSRVGVPVETRIAPGRYVIKAGVSAASAAGDLSSSAELRYGIGPRSDDKMSTVMWGYRAPSSTIAAYGFTHGYYYSKCVTGSRTHLL